MRMRLALQKLLCLLPLLLVLPTGSDGAALERGTAITDPEILRALDASGLSLARMLGADPNSSGADLFALPSMTIVRDATDRDFNRYVVDRKDASGKPNRFDRAALNTPGTRFDLAGIVNRMDRAFVSPDTCGEIRLIYRPIANHDSTSNDAPPSRLPMTFNLVMKAKPVNAGISCAELAKRWLDSDDAGPANAERAAMLIGKGGALEWITPEAIDRIELNIQIAREAADANDFDGRADYLMKVFRLNPRGQLFEESPLENQIDVDRLLTDATLAADFRKWLLTPANFADLDRGPIVLPDRFLALSAINATPAHTDAEVSARKLFSDDDIVAALAKASASSQLENIQSFAGFARRLDDITCSGCHQTRSIGGFHFPGREQPGMAPGAVVAAASPHFFGDQHRRRDILAAFRDGAPPDFSRGFSARPQPRRAAELAGTTYFNGWGAVCTMPEARGQPDRSFSSWTCAEGLSCQTSPGATNSRAGFCFLKSD